MFSRQSATPFEALHVLGMQEISGITISSTQSTTRNVQIWPYEPLARARIAMSKLCCTGCTCSRMDRMYLSLCKSYEIPIHPNGDSSSRLPNRTYEGKERANTESLPPPRRLKTPVPYCIAEADYCILSAVCKQKSQS